MYNWFSKNALLERVSQIFTTFLSLTIDTIINQVIYRITLLSIICNKINKKKKNLLQGKENTFFFFSRHVLPCNAKVPDPHVQSVLGICQQNNKVATSMNNQLGIGNLTHNLLNVRGLLGIVLSAAQLAYLDLIGGGVLLNDGRKHIICNNVSAKDLVTCCGVEGAIVLVSLLVNNGSSNETPKSDQAGVGVFVPCLRDPDAGAIAFVFKFCHVFFLLVQQHVLKDVNNY